jgi:hypothetical protein
MSPTLSRTDQSDWLASHITCREFDGVAKRPTLKPVEASGVSLLIVTAQIKRAV